MVISVSINLLLMLDCSELLPRPDHSSPPFRLLYLFFRTISFSHREDRYHLQTVKTSCSDPQYGRININHFIFYFSEPPPSDHSPPRPLQSSRKNVMFGPPNVVEFNKTSPVGNMTPMGKEASSRMFSMVQKG